jgi:hypothetical protein
MNFIAAPQGTPEWYAARCATTTASCFSDAIKMVGGLDERQSTYVKAVRGGMPEKDAMVLAGYKMHPRSAIITRALAGEDTRDPSDEARRYAADIAIERVSGKPHGEPAKAWVLERGHIMEAQARMIYEARTRAFVTEAGICKTDCGLFGYSTDGLVDDDGLIEIKAPIDSIKIFAMLETGDVSEYIHQIMGGLWITGRKWCDFIMYVPDLALVGKDLFVKRIHRDDEFIDAMVLELSRFQGMIDQYESIARLPHGEIIKQPEVVAPTAPSWRDQFLTKQL